MFGKALPLRCLSVALATACVAPAVRAGEFVASVYGGKAWTANTDVTLHQPGGTDLRFEKVRWDDQSFEVPYYWGARLTWWANGRWSDSKWSTSGWSEGDADWGVALDFTHAKATANLDQNVHVTGTRGGTPVNADERLGNTFAPLTFTHGLNTLIATALYRWPSWRTDAFGEIRPYAGAGYGVAWPHVEIGVGGQSVFEYRFTGAAYQGLAGLDFKVFERVSVFVEYKVSQADIRADIPGGSTVRLRPWTHHALLGAAYRF